MKLYDIIFCDDIRYEINNKLSLMGLYNDKIVFRTDQKQLPPRIKLSALLRFKLEVSEEYPDRFEFEYIVNNKSLPKLDGIFQIDNNQSLTQIFLTLTAEGLPLEPGNLGFSIKIHRGNKLLLSEKHKQAIQVLVE